MYFLSNRVGLFGSIFEYGCDKKISRHSRVAAKVSIGIPSGVTLRLKLGRASQTFLFPIHLAHDISPQAIFYGTVAPVLTYWLIKVLVVGPFLNRQKTEEIAKERDAKQEQMEQKKKEAQAEVSKGHQLVWFILKYQFWIFTIFFVSYQCNKPYH